MLRSLKDFGFSKYRLSVTHAERVLLPAVRGLPDATIAVDGFSGRERIRMPHRSLQEGI